MYFKLVLSLLGEECAKNMKISPVFSEQDGEQLDLLGSPNLRFFFSFNGLRT